MKILHLGGGNAEITIMQKDKEPSIVTWKDICAGVIIGVLTYAVIKRLAQNASMEENAAWCLASTVSLLTGVGSMVIVSLVFNTSNKS